MKLIKFVRNDGTEHWINPMHISAISSPQGRYEGTIFLSDGTKLGFARPSDLGELVSEELEGESDVS